jgi:hypothetical protein
LKCISFAKCPSFEKKLNDLKVPTEARLLPEVNIGVRPSMEKSLARRLTAGRMMVCWVC